MKVLICGDREWDDREKIRGELRALRKTWDVLEICEGECRGADTIAREEAERMGIPVRPFPADWRRYGKRAGPIRNRQMLKEFAPDMVLAFHDDIERSRGTRDMVTIARAANIPTHVFRATRSRVA